MFIPKSTLYMHSLLISMGGLILDFTVSSYKGIAVFQPVINGVGGNLVAVQASRISTALHAAAPLGKLPKFAAELCINPCSAFCARGECNLCIMWKVHE